MTSQNNDQPDPEIAAISEVYSTLKGLQPDAQLRVLQYVTGKLNLTMGSLRPERDAEPAETRTFVETAHTTPESSHKHEDEAEENDGISPAGRKWIRRNGFTVEGLTTIFSIGGEEIDLIAKKVPGDSKSKRMRSVFLLKGLAAYLASGAARFSHKDAKETSLHYDAFDANNFAQNFRLLAAEVSGSKDTGYSLTARGLTAAAEMAKGLVSPPE
jgi:hypothetical protein